MVRILEFEVKEYEIESIVNKENMFTKLKEIKDFLKR
jgi:hypothetical protein